MTTPMNNLGIVKRNIVRADKAAVARLAKLGVATIHDSPAVATLVSRIADEYDKTCRLEPSKAVRRPTIAA